MSGYDQFFKQAKEARQNQQETFESAAAAPKIKKPKSSEQDIRRKMNMRPNKKKAPFPVVPVLCLAAVCTLLGWWSVDPQLPERIVSTFEVRFMGAAQAQDTKKQEKPAATKGKDAASSSASVNPEIAPNPKAVASETTEDLSYLEKLRERNENLDLREKELNELEVELQKQKVEIESRIKQLEELRTQIATVLKERIEVDQEKVNKLVETYSNMKPKQAAEILAGIDEDLAVEVLGKMKKKNAAEIMNLLESGKARSISEKYAGYKRR